MLHSKASRYQPHYYTSHSVEEEEAGSVRHSLGKHKAALCGRELNQKTKELEKKQAQEMETDNSECSSRMLCHGVSRGLMMPVLLALPVTARWHGTVYKITGILMPG